MARLILGSAFVKWVLCQSVLVSAMYIVNPKCWVWGKEKKSAFGYSGVR